MERFLRAGSPRTWHGPRDPRAKILPTISKGILALNTQSNDVCNLLVKGERKRLFEKTIEIKGFEKGEMAFSTICLLIGVVIRLVLGT